MDVNSPQMRAEAQWSVVDSITPASCLALGEPRRIRLGLG